MEPDDNDEYFDLEAFHALLDSATTTRFKLWPFTFPAFPTFKFGGS